MSPQQTVNISFTREEYTRLSEAAGRKLGSQGIVSTTQIEHFIRDLVLGSSELHPGQVRHWFSEDELAAMVFQVGGAAIGVAMQDHPDYVMPTERLTEAIHGVMQSIGHDISGVPGYQPNKATSILRSATTEVQQG